MTTYKSIYLKPSGALCSPDEGSLPNKPEYCFTFSKSYPCDGFNCDEAKKAGSCVCYDRMAEFKDKLSAAIDSAPEFRNVDEVILALYKSTYKRTGEHTYDGVLSVADMKPLTPYPIPVGYQIEEHPEPTRGGNEIGSNGYYLILTPTKDKAENSAHSFTEPIAEAASKQKYDLLRLHIYDTLTEFCEVKDKMTIHRKDFLEVANSIAKTYKP